jgi:hypothetical protein
MNQDIESFEKSCENCSHPISLHDPHCSFISKENGKEICGCENAEYHNVIISKYVGWTEIRCNKCGKTLGYLQSTIENIDDYTTLCPKCIKSAT